MEQGSIFPWGITIIAFGSLIGGCSGKPTQDLVAVEQFIQEARQAGAEDFATEALKQAEESVEKVYEEISAQEAKFPLLQNYDNAEQLLVQAKYDAEQAKNEAVFNKMEAKFEAEAMVALARTTLDEARGFLAKTYTSKGSRHDIQVLKSDMRKAEASFTDLKAALKKGNYLAAQAKAESIHIMIKRVHEEMDHAAQKTGGTKA